MAQLLKKFLIDKTCPKKKGRLHGQQDFLINGQQVELAKKQWRHSFDGGSCGVPDAIVITLQCSLRKTQLLKRPLTGTA